MKKNEIGFWQDAITKNIYYSRYVLPLSIIIHILAFFGIDLLIANANISISLALRLIPIVYISLLIFLIKYNLDKIYPKILIYFFFAGLVSAFPIIYHGTYELNEQASLYGGGMGIFILKVIMTTFIFLQPRMMYFLYFLIDSLTILGFILLAQSPFLEQINSYIIFTALSNIVLLTTYHVYLDFRKSLYFSKLELEKEVKFKEQYFSFLAHDIKTPVSLLQSALDLLKSDEIDSQRKAYYLERMDYQLHSLNNLVINILSWIKSNNNAITLNPILIRANMKINKIIDLNSRIAMNKNLEIILEFAKDDEIIFDINSLEIAMNNIIRNAYKFADKNSKIYIQTSRNSHNFEITVSNTGVEFDDNQIKQFNLGEKIDLKQGSIGEKGSGLGLEIIKNLCKLNNAQFIIEKSGNKTTSKIITPNH